MRAGGRTDGRTPEVMFLYPATKVWQVIKTKFQKYRLLVLEKKIFKVFTRYGHSGHFDHVTQTILTTFRS